MPTYDCTVHRLQVNSASYSYCWSNKNTLGWHTYSYDLCFCVKALWVRLRNFRRSSYRDETPASWDNLDRNGAQDDVFDGLQLPLPNETWTACFVHQIVSDIGLLAPLSTPLPTNSSHEQSPHTPPPFNEQSTSVNPPLCLGHSSLVGKHPLREVDTVHEWTTVKIPPEPQIHARLEQCMCITLLNQLS